MVRKERNMTNQATTTTIKKTIVGAAAAITSVLALSTLATPDAEAKKNQELLPLPKYNLVQCVNHFCDGTDGRDRLVGTAEREYAQGKEGNDLYDTKGGPSHNERDYSSDFSATSNDSYLVPSNQFGHMAIDDFGGSSDVIDLSSYNFADFDFLKYDDEGQGTPANDLLINGPGSRLVTIIDHFDVGTDGGKTIETFKFKDGNRTADQVLK
jgi:hypothetical protein